MTREEAKRYIIQHCNPDYPNGSTEWETAMNMAIEALQQPEQPKNGGDIWDRLSEVYNMDSVPDEAKSIIGDVMIEVTEQPEQPITCKDCKHHYVDGENVRFNVCELNHNKVQNDDWFCADAERKDDETE